MSRLLINNIGRLYSMNGAVVKNGELEIEDGRILYAGPARNPSTDSRQGNSHPVPCNSQLATQTSQLKPRNSNPYPPAPIVTYPATGLTSIDARGAVVTPGLVDPHTHVVYGGTRAFEMPLKSAGVPYLEILERGGGILATVRATREATEEELFESARTRLASMASHGTTTVEVKSGYGLSTEHELRILEVVRRLDRELPLTIVPTFMGAHAVPQEFRSQGADAYADEVVRRMLPAIAEQGIAQFGDVFCEPGVFDVEQSRRILAATRDAGLGIKIHADEIEIQGEGVSGSQLAAELGAISADHLRATGPEGFAAMREAGVVPVVLPATSFCLRDNRYADARTMIDEYGLPVALATDCNPGTSPTESLQLVMAIAALELRMTPEEILAGVTINATRAIDMEAEVGSLTPGKLGDAVLWQAYDLDVLPYRLGVNQAAVVIKEGKLLTTFA